MNNLPIEVLILILDHIIDVQDVVNLGQACQATRAATKDGRLWKRICESLYCDFEDPELISNVTDHRQFYFDQLEINHKVRGLVNSLVIGPSQKRLGYITEISQLGSRAKIMLEQIAKLSTEENIEQTEQFEPIELSKQLGQIESTEPPRQPELSLSHCYYAQELYNVVRRSAAFKTLSILAESMGQQPIDLMSLLIGMDGFYIEESQDPSTRRRQLESLENQFVKAMLPYDSLSPQPKAAMIFTVLRAMLGSDWACNQPISPGDYNHKLFIAGFLTPVLKGLKGVDRFVVSVIYQHFARLVGVESTIVRLQYEGDYCRIDSNDSTGGFFLVDMNHQGLVKSVSEVESIFGPNSFTPSTQLALIRNFIYDLVVDVELLDAEDFEVQKSCLLGVLLILVLFDFTTSPIVTFNVHKFLLKYFPLDIHIIETISLRCGSSLSRSTFVSQPPRRRHKECAALHRVGQICTLKTNYAIGRSREVRGIIIGWDPTCEQLSLLTDTWHDHYEVKDPTRSYYIVLTKGNYSYYEPESSITIESHDAKGLYDYLEMKPCMVGKYFDRFDSTMSVFVPNEELRAMYPDDDNFETSAHNINDPLADDYKEDKSGSSKALT